MAKFVIKMSGDQFHFVLKAGNGEIIGQSETYKAKASALNGIESVRKNSQREGAFEMKVAKNGKFHFCLKAKNGEPVLQSQLYKSEDGANNGIASIMKNAPEAELVDETA